MNVVKTIILVILMMFFVVTGSGQYMISGEYDLGVEIAAMIFMLGVCLALMIITSLDKKKTSKLEKINKLARIGIAVSLVCSIAGSFSRTLNFPIVIVFLGVWILLYFLTRNSLQRSTANFFLGMWITSASLYGFLIAIVPLLSILSLDYMVALFGVSLEQIGEVNNILLPEIYKAVFISGEAFTYLGTTVILFVVWRYERRKAPTIGQPAPQNNTPQDPTQ